MPTIKSPRTIKFIMPVMAIIIATISIFAFTRGASSTATKVKDHYRFTLNSPSMATNPGYVSNVNNWSSNLVAVDEQDFQCQPGNYQPCEIITPIADVNSSTQKLKGSISESMGSSSYYTVSSYTPTSGSASVNNRKQ